MSTPAHRLCDAEGVYALERRLAEAILANRRPDAPLGLVGVRTRGFPIAQRLAALLEPKLGVVVPVGAVDITLYRDDLDRPRRWPTLRETHIPFPVDDAEIVLVDDVLHTGRTIRAALNAVCDLGRPACVRLVALVDRGGRELPIRPDHAGLTLQVPAADRVLVRIPPQDEVAEIIRLEAPGLP